MFSIRVLAPGDVTLYILRAEPINPYEKIWEVICKAESNNDPLAYHMEDNGHPSIGIVQIQQSRLDDFNKRTGNNYILTDMYVPENARIVFMHYTSEISPYNNERICREWNGGEKGMTKKSTIKYWRKIKANL